MSAKDIVKIMEDKNISSANIVYYPGGKPIMDEVYDDVTGEWKYGETGEYTEQIFRIEAKIINPSYRSECLKRDQLIKQVENAKLQNSKISQENNEAEKINSELIRFAQSNYIEYWRAACKAVNLNDNSVLKNMIRENLEQKLKDLENY